MRTGWIAVALTLAACSKDSASSSADRCAAAYSHAASVGAFGGQGYGGEIALGFGMGCDQLTPDDLACVTKASTKDELDHCDHASQTLATRLRSFHETSDDAAPIDPKKLATIADAMCACKELRCLVGVGDHHRALLEELLASGYPTAPESQAVLTRLGDCLDKLERR